MIAHKLSKPFARVRGADPDRTNVATPAARHRGGGHVRDQAHGVHGHGAVSDAPRARRGYSLLGAALAFGMTLTSAHAIPALVAGDYSTGTGVAEAYGAMSGSATNPTANTVPGQGGLCQQSALATGCLSLAPSAQGPALQSGLTGALANFNGTIAISPVMLTSGDNNYDLIIQINDLSTTAGSYYGITLDGNYLGQTPLVTEGGGTKSTGSISVVLSDGNLTNPTTEYLGITNDYFANTGSPAFSGSKLSLSVTEVDAPEPASLAVFATGLGLLGLLRRYRAGA